MRLKLPTRKDTERMVLTRSMIETALFALEIPHTASPKEATMRCIFHDDAEGGKPNLYMNLDKKPGVYHCFAASCQVRGPFVEFVKRYTGWSEIKTLQFIIGLRKMTNSEVNIDEGFVPERPSQRGALNYDVSVLDKYDYRHPYLYERGLNDAVLQRFCIGYDKSDDKITFPWFDRNGKLVTIKRRAPDRKFYSYPAEADLRSTLFGLNLVRQHSVVWVDEGEFDTLSMDQFFRLAHFDTHYSVALGGSTLHATQLASLLKKQPVALVEMLDNDEGGRQAAQEMRRTIGGSVKLITAPYPDGVKDPNELTFDQKLTITQHVESLLTDDRKVSTLEHE